jgi:hypothetical protein
MIRLRLQFPLQLKQITFEMVFERGDIGMLALAARGALERDP